MGATKTLDDLNTVLADFSKQIERIRNSPEDVEEAFRKGAIALAAAEGGTFGGGPIGAAIGATYGAITQDDFTGTMQDNKEEIKDKIVELLSKLQDAIDGLKAPIALLQVSGDWLNVQTEINKARNWVLVKTDLRGKWSGAAADEYFAAQQLQVTATDTASSNCDVMSDCLAAASDAAWDFYSKIVKDLIDFFVDLGAALAKIATGVGAPFGASDAIDALGSMIKIAGEYAKTLGDTLLAQKKIINKINSSTDNPRSFHNNKWPEIGTGSLSIDSPNSEKWAAR
ncbi:hypothetical protein AB0L63_30855 [Nocardia sp. NPDC051990]|uniref:hypothetical protein n=1 Tax=Nocardia sp. NPDC051990 TaxID=3155285 RepID=UPI003424EEA4